MKYIMKNRCPEEYAQWCQKVANTEKADFNEIPSDEKQALLNSLMMEQGFICGYTMKRIDKSTSHIEHIKPQSRCRKDQRGSDLEYNNLIACYPLNGMKKKYRFGAQQKEDWWENDGKEFLSPLDQRCEIHFHFDLEGKVTSSNIAAATTIEVLALDHESLTEERKRVIEEFIYGPDKNDPISKSKAIRAVSSICDRQNGSGCYYEFCVAIRSALKQYMMFLEKVKR